jgi:hypothetical protein
MRSASSIHVANGEFYSGVRCSMRYARESPYDARFKKNVNTRPEETSHWTVFLLQLHFIRSIIL